MARSTNRKVKGKQKARAAFQPKLVGHFGARASQFGEKARNRTPDDLIEESKQTKIAKDAARFLRSQLAKIRKEIRQNPYAAICKWSNVTSLKDVAVECPFCANKCSLGSLKGHLAIKHRGGCI